VSETSESLLSFESERSRPCTIPGYPHYIDKNTKTITIRFIHRFQMRLPTTYSPNLPQFPLALPNDEIGTEWGHYMGPARAEHGKTEEGLRVAIFGSYRRGLSVLSTLIGREIDHPNSINLVGLATDDREVRDPFSGVPNTSRISSQKRVWQYVPVTQQTIWQGIMEGLATRNGVPAYCGPIKSDFFRETVLPQWNPDLIIMATFGQLIDAGVIEYPRFGMYNFHPSHLAENQYPGPNPFQEMCDAGEAVTRMTLHKVSTVIDDGQVVGFSPPIRITRANGTYPTVPDLHKKTSPTAGLMALALVEQVAATQEKVDKIDLEAIFSDQEKVALMEAA